MITRLAAARRKGLRPDALGGLGNGKDRSYMLSLVPNPSELAWELKTEMTVAEYETAVVVQRKLGRRPLAVMSEARGNEVRYLALWIEYSPHHGSSGPGEKNAD